MSVLILGHVESDGALAKPALEALTAGLGLAKQLGVPAIVGLAGADVSGAAGAIGGCGAARVLGVGGAAFGEPRYVTDAAAAEALCRTSGS
jgi:electron transfer flavoprotein alpha subunit